jgi:glycosyltransferase involved in cell wall biosynthesis
VDQDPASVRLFHVATVPLSLWYLLVGQIGFMKSRGLEVHALAAPGELLDALADREGIPVHAVDMQRQVTPFRDLVSLVQIWRTFRRIRPHIVHAQTPKGGLLGSLGAWLAMVPVRIYHIRGLPYMTATGWKRRLLRLTERVACACAHQVLCVSHTLRQIAISEGFCPAGKISTLLKGSSNGVDASGKYNPARVPAEERDRTRARYGIPADAQVVGFVGRIVRDKGLTELVEAWQALREEWPRLHLLIVGPFESEDPVPPEVEKALRHDPRIHLVGADWNTPPLYRAMDLVALPTYREGCPNVLLEASAMELPVVATRIPGCVDVVEDGETGLLVPAHDAPALSEALRRYLNDPSLGRRHGRAGRERVLRDFATEQVWEALYEQYMSMVRAKGLRTPEVALPDQGGDAAHVDC